MKNKIIVNLYFFTTIALIVFSINTFAQNQSILLPISGSYITSPPDGHNGCKMINFSNTSTPIVTELPKWTFGIPGINDDPQVEGNLQSTNISSDPNDPFYLFNTEYLGQHPMFAQTVVHDKDGNLLFFIVDNNIYNRYGKAGTANSEQLSVTKTIKL